MPEKTRSRRASGSKPGASSRGGPRRASRGGSKGPAKKTPSASNIKPLTPTLDPPDIESFTEFDLGPEIQAAIAAMGITKPTPIQALSIEPVLKGKDVIAKAETGTGKTLAFGAPMMSKIEPGRSTVLGLVLSPTRELAEQVYQVLVKLGEPRGLQVALIVGGEPLGPQVKQLQAGAQVVVGTPGRVLDLMNQRFLQFPWTEFAILDEADKMLEIGFIDDIKKILDACNEYRQTLLFSATFPPQLLELARGYTGEDPAEIATASGVATVDTINQYVLRSSTEDYGKNLANMIEDSGPDDVFLVFCERRTDVDQLLRKLERRRFSVKALHGGYDQAARFRVMTAFRTGDVKCLLATDVASRGLDVAHVTHVVNLGLPREFSDYTHRIGRTGRAGRHGAAVTFISGRNERDFTSLLKHTGFDIEEISRPRDLFSRERKRAQEREAGDDAVSVPSEVVENDAQEAVEEKPRRERRPRRRSESEASEASERPRRERRPRKTEDEEPRSERPRRTRRKAAAEVEEAPREVETPTRREDAEAPARKRRPRRRARSEERSERSAEPAREERDEPVSERRPRRSRRAAPEPAPEPAAAAEDMPEERPRRARRRRESSTPVEAAEESTERPRRRPRRREREEAAIVEDEAPPRRRPRRERPAETDEARPRRSRRPRSENADEQAPVKPRREAAAKSTAESSGKDDSARPKRGRRGETSRQSETTPSEEAPRRRTAAKRPSASGGFGSGI